MSPKRLLLVYYNGAAPQQTRLTITQHVHGLEAGDTPHHIVYYNAFDDCPASQLDAEPLPCPAWACAADFDAVVLHYSFLAFHWNEMALLKWKRLFRWIGEMHCRKVALPQDEYDRAGLLDEWLFDWGVSTVFSCFDAAHRGPLYPFTRRRAQLAHCLTGYIDHQSAQQYAQRLRPLSERPVDIVYRARHLPFWFGSAGQLKHRLGDIVAPRAQAMGLRCDISTRGEDVILGTRWLDFMASSRAVIGCESGVGVIDWRGEIEAQVRAILQGNPELSFEQVSARMPHGWDSYRLFASSPRHFEAIITKTCQILVEGEYSGVLEPNKHYIPVKRDFSNLDEALEKLRDNAFVEDLVERAYHDIYLSGKYTYRAFAHHVEQTLFGDESQGRPQTMTRVSLAENDATMEHTLVALERQLIVERHAKALLEAKLLEARQHCGALSGQVQLLTGDLQTQLHARFDTLQGQLNLLHEQLHTRFDGAQGQLNLLHEQLHTRFDGAHAQLNLVGGQWQTHGEALQERLHILEIQLQTYQVTKKKVLLVGAGFLGLLLLSQACMFGLAYVLGLSG